MSIETLEVNTTNYTLEVTNGTTQTLEVTEGVTLDLLLSEMGLQGPVGPTGKSISSVVKTSTAGLVDTYTITFSDSTTQTFTVTNGADGSAGIDGVNGRGIVSITRTSGTGAAGTTDTYTITYTDATTSTFSVYNGANGTGSVSSVGLSVPTGLTVSNSPITTSGTLAVTYTAGYSIPTTVKQGQWDTAYGWGNHASAGYLTGAAIGSTVQGYDSDLTVWAGKTAPAGTVVGTTDTQSLLNKELVAPRETKVSIPASDIDLSLGSVYTKTITGTTTFTVSNIPPSDKVCSFILELTNAGAFTLNLWASVKWSGGVSPVLTASGVDVLGFYTADGGTTWRGFVLSKDNK